jgi:aspartate/methionine/tyrosine aminotransferase
MRLARRISRLGTESAFEVLARARALEAQGRKIIHLEIGEPDFDTPPHIVEAAVNALRGGFTHYGPSAGLMEARECIAKNIARRRGIQTVPQRVVITNGAKPIMFYTILAVAQQGDEVVYPDPGFPIYYSMAAFAGAKAVPWRFIEEEGYHPDLDDLKKRVNEKTRLIILNSPSNPTGCVFTQDEIKFVADLVKRYDNLYVLADEVYKDIVFEGKYHSITQLPGMLERTIILDGFSKSYAMTGWRLGYGYLPENLVDPVVRMVTNSVSCAPPAFQKAGIAALDGPQDSVRAMTEEFRARRELVMDGLSKIPGVRCSKPAGAFYAMPNISGTGMTSKEFESRAMNEAGVALLSGTAFGVYGEGYVRISFANSRDNLRKALSSLKEMVEKAER